MYGCMKRERLVQMFPGCCFEFMWKSKIMLNEMKKKNVQDKKSFLKQSRKLTSSAEN